MPSQFIVLQETRVGIPHRVGGPEPVWSSIHKRPLHDLMVYLTPLGLAGDTITDTALVDHAGQPRHGGYARAVYAFPWQRHGAVLLGELGKLAVTNRSVGENLRVTGADERTVHVGDEWEWGKARLQVTGPRIPGWTLQTYYGGLSVGQVMIQHGMCGWFLRVLRPGPVPIMGKIKVTNRRTDNPTISEMFQQMVADLAIDR